MLIVNVVFMGFQIGVNGNLIDPHGSAPVGTDIGWSGAIGAMVDLRRPLSQPFVSEKVPMGIQPILCRWHGRPSGRHPRLCDSPGTRL
jgi:hypothetical protein